VDGLTKRKRVAVFDGLLFISPHHRQFIPVWVSNYFRKKEHSISEMEIEATITAIKRELFLFRTFGIEPSDNSKNLFEELWKIQEENFYREFRRGNLYYAFKIKLEYLFLFPEIIVTENFISILYLLFAYGPHGVFRELPDLQGKPITNCLHMYIYKICNEIAGISAIINNRRDFYKNYRNESNLLYEKLMDEFKIKSNEDFINRLLPNVDKPWLWESRILRWNTLNFIKKTADTDSKIKEFLYSKNFEEVLIREFDTWIQSEFFQSLLEAKKDQIPNFDYDYRNKLHQRIKKEMKDGLPALIIDLKSNLIIDYTQFITSLTKKAPFLDHNALQYFTHNMLIPIKLSKEQGWVVFSNISKQYSVVDNSTYEKATATIKYIKENKELNEQLLQKVITKFRRKFKSTKTITNSKTKNRQL